MAVLHLRIGVVEGEAVPAVEQARVAADAGRGRHGDLGLDRQALLGGVGRAPGLPEALQLRRPHPIGRGDHVTADVEGVHVVPVLHRGGLDHAGHERLGGRHPEMAAADDGRRRSPRGGVEHHGVREGIDVEAIEGDRRAIVRPARGRRPPERRHEAPRPGLALGTEAASDHRQLLVPHPERSEHLAIAHHPAEGLTARVAHGEVSVDADRASGALAHRTGGLGGRTVGMTHPVVGHDGPELHVGPGCHPRNVHDGRVGAAPDELQVLHASGHGDRAGALEPGPPVGRPHR